MARYQFWNGTDTIYTPSGAVFSPEEWKRKFPWCTLPGVKMVISAPPINGGCALEFSSMKEEYRRRGALIPEDMPDEQALYTMELFEDNPPNSGESTPEERIAAALELQNLLSMPDEREDDPDVDADE